MSDYPYGTDEALFFALFSGLWLGVFAFYFVLIVGSYVLMSIALMQFFKKVGVSPGIAWVPIYSTWKWLEVGGQKGWLSLLGLAGAGIVTSVFLYIGMYRTGFAFRKDTGFLVLGIFFPFVWCFVLGSRNAVYEPGLLAAHGYPPPLAGYGAVPEGQRMPDDYYRQAAYAAQQQAYAQQYPGHPSPGQPQPGPQQYPGQQPPV